ncbi:DNA polymerase [Agromyces rhizosphaerae]|uniref:DNA polymerase n=1 Tax=Agromyces rhizosphaerae TaxID=88374 RepID=A0A9W6D124_9MICO|nr:DNA polymerase Y family protein [Agromyces rhizosphaerae]GLI28914.1 DNA polymerase [Agromyces rhizosphaerae]
MSVVPEASDPRRTIVVWCPDWPVIAAAREAGLSLESPLALVEKGLVFACSAAARRDGVARGLKLREAQYRSPALELLDYDAALDARAFEPVVRRVEETTPGVQLLRPGALAVRARGPVRYYGGEAEAAEALRAAVGGFGLPVRVGVADGPFAAEQAARATSDSAPVRRVEPGGSAAFIAPLPVGVLVDPRTATLLHRLGVRRLGEFAALPADDVLRRFGPTGSLAHDRAAGRDGARVLARTPPPEWDEQVEFEPPLDRIDQLAFAFRTRAESFIERLTAAKLVCTAVHVEIVDDEGGVSARDWLHPRWFTPGDVVDRIRWQLQGSGSAGAGLRSPIARVRVHPERLDSTGNHEEGLWGTGPDERVHHGLTRVQGMLGHEGVVTATIGGGRMLADREVHVPWGDRPPEGASDRPWPGSLPSPLPATVFRERVPAGLVDADGAVVTVDERGSISAPPAAFTVAGLAPGGQRRVRAWAGPWPVVERWWDEATARRAHRFQVVDDDGAAWLLVRDADEWRAEARYD